MFIKSNENGEVVKFPYSFGMFRNDHPNVSVPRNMSHDLCAQFHVYPVASLPFPAYEKRTQRLRRWAEPRYDEGAQEWQYGHTVENMTDAEIAVQLEAASRLVRAQRNKELDKYDYVIVRYLERGVEIPQEWRDFRQALRDLTSQQNFPWEVVYPQAPSDG